MAATNSAAAALVTRAGRAASAWLAGTGSTRSAGSAIAGAVVCGAALLLAASAADAASNKVRLSNLTDINFGTIATLGSDAAQSESVCLFADTATNRYNVTATGTGPGGAFQLTSGLSSMSYDVQWASSAGQTAGVQLGPNVPLTGQTSAAAQQTCNAGPAATASLIIVLRSAALSGATAGTYSGTLTLVVGVE